MTDWAARIGRHVAADGCVMVPPRIALWLEQKAGVTADRRILLRDTDTLAYEVLAALHLAALTYGYGSDSGTKLAAVQPHRQDSDEWCELAATQVDHVVSVARGGTDDMSNCQAACRPCHLKKTAQETAASRNRWKRPPERHPADFLRGDT